MNWLPMCSGAGKYASQVLAPTNRVGDEQGVQLTGNGVVTPSEFKVAYASFVDAGWQALSAPEKYGGMSLPLINVDDYVPNKFGLK